MSGGKKALLWIIGLVLAYGLSCPWQKVSQPIFLGFLPAPLFYLLVVHVLFVVFIAYLAFGTKLQGKVENEAEFLASLKKEDKA